ncbi:hypothetical protein AVEN_3811-1 [Araneus ventricosus]|uniref:Reverse transcriptase RNase H-like domain-containing protein n=1 Tax=Araneus ventricosus TaxID=182803 RepID=A0A4Y2HE66_ARAVE|nr:hypothetical protein AVEN_3811-1 [Araneus ventricosus]
MIGICWQYTVQYAIFDLFSRADNLQSIVATNLSLFAFCQKTDKFSPRQSRQLEFLAQFSTNIRHVSGEANTVADAFSRIDGIHLPVKIDFDAIAKEQKSDSSLESLLKTGSGLDLKPIKFLIGAELIRDVSTGNIRPYVAEKFRKIVFDSMQSLSHPGCELSSGPVFIWNSQPIKRTSLKYLVVILDEKLNWISHIQEQGAKALSHYKKIYSIARPRWGLKQKYKRILYQRVTERVLLYVVSAWALSVSPRLKKIWHQFRGSSSFTLQALTEPLQQQPCRLLQVSCCYILKHMIKEIEFEGLSS